PDGGRAYLFRTLPRLVAAPTAAHFEDDRIRSQINAISIPRALKHSLLRRSAVHTTRRKEHDYQRHDGFGWRISWGSGRGHAADIAFRASDPCAGSGTPNRLAAVYAAEIVYRRRETPEERPATTATQADWPRTLYSRR